MSIVQSVKSSAVGVSRRLLERANIEPATVKAIIRKPALVHGGPRARRMPWPRRRHFDKRERDAVIQLMNREIRRGGAIIYGGVEQKAYCAEFANYLEGGFAHAVNSGTNAVYVALKSLDLKPGTEVIVPPITDPGGTMPVALVNCIPVPADSDPGSLNTSAEQIERVLSERTSAIVVAHIAGQPVDMDPILELAARHNIPVVEDCAQALGAVYKGRMAGSLGTVSAFSTMFGKQHCTGAQGGVVFTKDTLLFARIRQVADRGKPYGTVGNPGNVIASLNFNQDEISMAIGRVQLQKLPHSVSLRRKFAALVKDGLQNLDGVLLIEGPKYCLSSPWFLMITVDPASLNCNSTDFAAALIAEGIEGVQAGYPFYPTDQPWHRDGVVFGTSGQPWSMLPGSPTPRHFELPNAHEANKTIVRIDVHESLGPREAKDLVTAIKKVAWYYKGVKSTSVSSADKNAATHEEPLLAQL